MGFLPQNLEKNSKFLYLFIIAAIFLISVGFYFNSKKLKVIPSINYAAYLYSDVADGGNSEGVINYSNNSIVLNYIINRNIEYPYVGFSVEDTSRLENFDISDYEELNITISAGKAAKIPIYIVAFIDGVTDTSKTNTYARYMYELDYDNSINTFSIPLKSFVLPEWWYKINNRKVGEFKKDFSQINSINIESGKFVGETDINYIKLEQLSFSAKRKWHWYIIAFVLLSLLILLIKKIAKQSTVFISYKETEDVQDKSISRMEQLNEQKIINYIAENYDNPELSLTIIQQELKISSTSISKIIKHNFNLSFKKYINQIRLNEAKRLLKDSNLSISEIAYKVGYNNVSHFNRVFKQEFDISPSDYKFEQ
jgi:AraC-like DNA-binding protein